MIPNPFLIVSQREGEDRVTYALGTSLAAGGASLLVELLRALGADLPNVAGPLDVEFQSTGPVSRPDARFEIPDGMTVLFENKVVPGALYEDQICNHLAAFGSARPSARKVILAITPDAPPDWWPTRARAEPSILFVHGTWAKVTAWARSAATDESRIETVRLLLNGMIDYLEQRSGMDMAKAAFDSQRMARVAKGAKSWLKDMEEQHAAQEAFFANVASSVRAALGAAEDEPGMKIASRSGKAWAPVSTYLEFRWPTPKLPEMPAAHVWAEAYLDEEAGQITLRTGLLLEGKTQVATWYGIAKEIASQTFGDRYWEYRQGGAYAEVWASQPLNLEQLGATQDAVAADLVTWVTKVLDGMAVRGAR